MALDSERSDAERLARLRRANEILEAMPPDGRSDEDRLRRSEWLARQEFAQNGAESEPTEPFALPLDEFIADKQDAPQPLLGTEDDNIIPAHGLGLVIGKGGKGKTTFVVDLALHLASGVDYLGLKVERPLSILLIEKSRGPGSRSAASWSASSSPGPTRSRATSRSTPRTGALRGWTCPVSSIG